MKKLMILSVLVTAAVLAGWFTLAGFVDSETTFGNSFTANPDFPFDLVVSDSDEGDANGVTNTWSMAPMFPGLSVTSSMQFKNVGSVAANHLELSFDFAIDETSNPVESDTDPASTWEDMARMLEVVDIVYDDGTELSNDLLSDVNSNGWLDLEDLTLPANSAALDDLSPPPPSGAGTRDLRIIIAFRTDAGNDLQGDILIMTVTATLNQDASQ